MRLTRDKNGEKEEMDRERLNSIVLEQTMEIVIVFAKDGEILYGNPAALEKLCYTQEELQECNMSQLFWQEFQQVGGNYAPFDGQKLSEKEETVIYRKNSSCFPVALRIIDIGDGTACLLAEDISLRKNMDVRIRQLKEEEEENQRVRNEFTANVTHELRTPVNGIRGHVTNLLEVVQDEEQRRILDVILFCCSNMSAIINNILDFSKMEAGKFTLEEVEFDFYKMMDQLISTHMAEINKKELHLSVYIDKNIPQFVIGDALRIGQILNNLLSNAVKFTLVGQISVDVSKTTQVGDEVELFFMVRDTGIGISKEDQDKLFQSFKQVDASITRRFGGTGLGLSITKQLVEMMNGAVHVESEKGKGSCFSFNIRLRTGQNTEEGADLQETYRNWMSLTGEMAREEEEACRTFGTEENKAELKRRLEKLMLSIELGSWERAETLAESIKALTETPEGETAESGAQGPDLKKLILRLKMALRKENYEKSMEANEQLKTALEEMLGEKLSS